MFECPTPEVGSVARFPNAVRSKSVSNELNKIRALVRDVCPQDAQISLCFDDELHVHIDIRVGVDSAPIETLLPTLGGGLFHSVIRGATPHRTFYRRISAIVDL